MALAKKYYSGYESSNGWEYYLEIWVEGFVGSASEIKLGTGGPIISYDTDDEGRFNTILASTLTVPMVVETPSQEAFITDLRDTYEEQEVYIHLYQSTAADEDPLWSGYVLMDLSSKSDEYFPYDVNLTATDGLSLLKDKDWVEVGATLPYDQDDVFWGPARFTYWISQVLKKTGIGGTGEGAYADAEFRTSVNWYNADHEAPAQGNDPMYLTKGKMSWTHEQDAQGRFIVMNTYDVLKAILKAWGCRITYWKHVFWIVQIPEYNTAETGTLAAPDNVNTRVYSLSGVVVGNRAYLGGANETRYQLQFDFSTPSEGVQKLKGTKYNFYPRVKKVTANFISGGGENYFGGFPHYDGTTLTQPILQETIIDANYATNLYLQIPLKVQQTFAGTIDYKLYFDLKATDGVTTKWLDNNGNTLSWQSSQPASYPNWDKPRATFSAVGTLPQDVLIFDEVIPTDAAFTGAWEFSIHHDSSSWGSGTASDFQGVDPNAGFGGTGIVFLPSTHGTTWSNIPRNNTGYATIIHQNGSIQYLAQGGNAFEGYFMTLNSTSGINIYGQNVMIETNTSDSDVVDFKELQWGDTMDGTDEGALLVYNGTSWVVTDFDGEWGVGTNSGTDSFTELLIDEFLDGQITNAFIINARIVVGATGKTQELSGVYYPKYINPIGRILENPTIEASRNFIFRRGKFHTIMDEWDYEGWEIQDEVATTTTTTEQLYYNGLPIEVDSGGPGARLANPASDPNISSRNAFVTQTTSTLTGTLTSIPINSIGRAVFVPGDKIILINRYGIDVHSLEINGLQAYDATSLTIVSYDFGTDTIPIGAVIGWDKLDLIKQYQNKTSGTVGGIGVTASRLGPLGSDGSIVGVDTEELIILPTDFMINDDAETPLVWKDSATTGVQITSTASEPITFVRIPYGKSATKVDIWGSANKPVEVYSGLVNANFNITTAADLADGSGEMNTQITLTDAVDSTSYTYLIIRVKLSSTSQRIWGGSVTIIDI